MNIVSNQCFSLRKIPAVIVTTYSGTKSAKTQYNRGATSNLTMHLVKYIYNVFLVKYIIHTAGIDTNRTVEEINITTEAD